MRTRRLQRVSLAGAILVVGALTVSTPAAHQKDGAVVAALNAHLGDLLLSGGHVREAIEAYERAFQEGIGPLRLRAGQQWVKSLLRTAEFRRARDAAAEVRLLSPRDADVLALEGDALWAAGLFDEAERAYQQALAIEPVTPRARNGLAKSLLSQGQIERAREEVHAAIAVTPNEADWHYTLASIHIAEHQYDDAAGEFARYVALLPPGAGGDAAVWALQQVKFLAAFGTKTPMRIRRGTEASVHRVPFRLERDKILVTARVNGGSAMPFVVDTGAEMAIVTGPVARRLGVRPDVFTISAGVGSSGLRGVLKGRIDRFQVGTLDLEQVPTLIRATPLLDMPFPETESFNPLALGFSVSIDYRNHTLSMTRRMDDAAAEALRLPLRLNRLALVRGLINRDNPAPFVVDTGGQVISISRSTASALGLQPPRHIPLKVYGASGWDPDAFLLPGLNLTFDRVHLENTAVAVLNLDAPSALLGFELGGIVGHKFLSRYRVTLDLGRSEMRLE
jgi:predicted aspartyl protease